MRLSLGEDLRHRDSYRSFMHMCPHISYVSVGGNRQLVLQIPTMDKILMGYWAVGQVRIMMSSVIKRSKFRKGDMILSRVQGIPCEIILRNHLSNIRRTFLLEIGRGTFCGLGCVL